RKILEGLLSAGADVSGKDENGNTPLHWASHFNNLEAAELLIKSGAQRNARDNAGETPLDLAESAEMKRLLQVPSSPLFTSMLMAKIGHKSRAEVSVDSASGE